MPPEPGRGWPPRFAATGADRDGLLVLAHLESLIPRDLHALAWREGSAARCLAAVRRGAAGTDGDRERLCRVHPAEVRAALEACGARALVPGDPEYPDRLLDLPDPPGCLFVRGGPIDGLDPAVAIVGARSCSPYGIEVAEVLGRSLAAAGVAVVSGAARGIDAAAHRGALAADGPTIAVLGSGIDVAYPRRHGPLLVAIARAGAVVSEYPPGTEPQGRRFPARNRLIAALSRAAVIVEGGPGSGSLITAEFAMELNRDVLAVPGPVTSPLSSAPHELIRDGAGLVRGPDDVLGLLGLSGASAGGSPPRDLPGDEGRAFLAVAGAPVTVETVARRLGSATPSALALLTSLEIRGLVREVGGRYERVLAPR